MQAVFWCQSEVYKRVADSQNRDDYATHVTLLRRNSWIANAYLHETIPTINDGRSPAWNDWPGLSRPVMHACLNGETHTLKYPIGDTILFFSR